MSCAEQHKMGKKLGQVVVDCPCFKCYMANGMSCKLGLFKNFKDMGKLVERLEKEGLGKNG